jgi:hypothetical protein
MKAQQVSRHSSIKRQETLGDLGIQQNGKTLTLTCVKFNVQVKLVIELKMNLNLFVTSFIKKTGAELTAIEKIQIRSWLVTFIQESIMLLKPSDLPMSVKEELHKKFSNDYFHPDEKKFMKELGMDVETYLLSLPDEYSPDEYEE